MGLVRLTSVDDEAHHGLRVPDGAAPQQQVVAVQAHAGLTGKLPVGAAPGRDEGSHYNLRTQCTLWKFR